MSNDSSLDVLLDDEYTDDSDDLFSISSYGADLSVRELSNMLKEGDLKKPDIQRNYVWKKIVAGRFIETILLGLPVPSIFLSKNEDSTFWIVDGLQRLTTLSDFISGKFDDGSSFKLPSSINPRWADHTFQTLTESDQRKIRTATIHAIIFKQDLPKDNDTSLFQIFERINTGGIRLSAQEIRNSIYHNYINEELITLNKLETWKKIVGKKLEARMRDIELILRFFLVFDLRDVSIDEAFSFSREMNLFMDLKSDKYDHSRNHIKKTSEIFSETMEVLSMYDKPFSNRTWLESIIFDAISVAFATQIEKGIDINLSEDDFNNKKNLLVSDEGFQELMASSRRTKFNLVQQRHLIAYQIFFGS
ncbi:GmrSD restriction endonuclease domain-containing protein [Convivina praedatoris]|uniref:GmrSD restriction endonucleases N-terminal domain-containing protein n=1 Tax=Convivina praedatoris TaxID=2880963 RepID=A0ABN8HE97_9LACO|nr:DUF262 domain-containing protein [Convivina sp. LMG 32447]CAH1855893.1 hypothetical protein R077815_01302 [Convivina sp. LMG 32447]CAH1856615.1 hypothetical protein LMG032447_01328 [Convivina sp. LMG 32447]CAH1856859.1 hypothetical protein R078138_01455 [Convivina sp. LMG 32447]